MTDALDHITTGHNADARRYEVLVNGHVIGKAHYVPFADPAGAQRIFTHTVVDDAYSGRGLGSRLVAFALDDTVASGLTIVPVCPYVSAFLGGHGEYAGNTTAVRPDHLAAARRR